MKPDLIPHQIKERETAFRSRQISAGLAVSKVAQAKVAATWKNGTYDAAELKTVRPGADDFLSLPSRVGERLFYRDGRVEYV